MYYHGAHTKYAAHAGLCVTDDMSSAIRYARGNGAGLLAMGEASFAGLIVSEVEAGYDAANNAAPGDDGNSMGADVLVFDDADASGAVHRTWRLMSAAAVARFVPVVVEVELLDLVEDWRDCYDDVDACIADAGDDFEIADAIANGEEAIRRAWDIYLS